MITGVASASMTRFNSVSELTIVNQIAGIGICTH